MVKLLFVLVFCFGFRGLPAHEAQNCAAEDAEDTRAQSLLQNVMQKQSVVQKHRLPDEDIGWHRLEEPSEDGGVPNASITSPLALVDDGRGWCPDSPLENVECIKEKYPLLYQKTFAVGILKMGGSYCTAWRVTKGPFLMTNAHCVKRGLSNTEVWFDYQRAACGGSAMQQPLKIHLHDATIVRKGKVWRDDYALIRFAEGDLAIIDAWQRDGYKVGYLSLVTDREPAVGERVVRIGHSRGHPKRIVMKSSKALASPWCSVDKKKYWSHPRFQSGAEMGYYCSGFGGSSGSPVLLWDGRVIGINAYGSNCLAGGYMMHSDTAGFGVWPEVKAFLEPYLDDAPQSTTPQPAPAPETTTSEPTSPAPSPAPAPCVDGHWKCPRRKSKCGRKRGFDDLCPLTCGKCTPPGLTPEPEPEPKPSTPAPAPCVDRHRKCPRKKWKCGRKRGFDDLCPLTCGKCTP